MEKSQKANASNFRKIRPNTAQKKSKSKKSDEALCNDLLGPKMALTQKKDHLIADLYQLIPNIANARVQFEKRLGVHLKRSRCTK